ncbi:MAG: UMP kinase [Nanoarchaeota archaeon]
MKREIIVISLGGSQIIKNGEINNNFLEKFKKIILKHSKTRKFIIVCGGGSVSRMYIEGLRKAGKSDKLQSYAGISITRHNARFMSYFFNEENEDGIPHDLPKLSNILKRRNFVFCGALEYKPNQTSDGTAAQIASHFNSLFINITNINGLYNKNPLEHKDAKFIPAISWNEFDKMANKLSFKPGQHFVLDQSASKIIRRNKIKTIIVGSNLNNLDKAISGKKFVGTLIYN